MRKEGEEGQEGRSGERHLPRNAIACASYHGHACCSNPPSGANLEKRVTS